MANSVLCVSVCVWSALAYKNYHCIHAANAIHFTLVYFPLQKLPHTLYMSKHRGEQADSAEANEENVKNQGKSLVIAIRIENTVLLIVKSRLNEAFTLHKS